MNINNLNKVNKLTEEIEKLQGQIERILNFINDWNAATESETQGKRFHRPSLKSMARIIWRPRVHMNVYSADVYIPRESDPVKINTFEIDMECLILIADYYKKQVDKLISERNDLL